MSGLFGRKTQQVIQEAPKPQPPAPMPDPLSPEVTEAKRRSQLGILSRGGRSSTILTGEADRGSSGVPYAATKLGAG